jgi:hypothetical protein
MHRLLFLVLCIPAYGQTLCPATPTYSVCDITFDVPGAMARDTELNAEFRGPSHRTFLIRAFRSAGNRLTVRFSPSEAGTWDVRLSSTLAELHDKQLQITATPSNSNGWIEPANLHHFRYTGGAALAALTPPHLWVGDTLPSDVSGTTLESWVMARSRAGVTHVRVQVPNFMEEAAFDELDVRLALINKQNMVADLILSPPAGDRQAREDFFKYVIARCAARNVTWVILSDFEKRPQAHDLVREISSYLDEDPFHHPRTVGGAITSGVFADEKWLEFREYGSPDWRISDVEDQIYAKPAISVIKAASPDDFRHQLWNSTMSGTYPEAVSTDPSMLTYLGVWQKALADTRHWELEPFFDVDNGRGLSLPQTEYLIYVEKPGAVVVRLDGKHKWNVEWINPLDGQVIESKDLKDENFNGSTPDNSHDWVLHIYREGHKEGLKSYHFESRPVLMQDVEVNAEKVPFEIAQPAGDSIAATAPVPYAARLKRETKASRNMIYLWTGEVTADGEGYRVLGTAASGEFRIPAGIVRHYPATLHMRVYGLNGLGKLYSLDQNFGIAQ